MLLGDSGRIPPSTLPSLLVTLAGLASTGTAAVFGPVPCMEPTGQEYKGRSLLSFPTNFIILIKPWESITEFCNYFDNLRS